MRSKPWLLRRVRFAPEGSLVDHPWTRDQRVEWSFAMAEPSRAFENASIRTRLSELGATAIAGSPVQFGFIAEEIEKYASVILSAKTQGTGSETLPKGPPDTFQAAQADDVSSLGVKADIALRASSLILTRTAYDHKRVRPLKLCVPKTSSELMP